MYIGYSSDQQSLGFDCIKDQNDAKKIERLFKTGTLYVFLSSNLLLSNFDLDKYDTQVERRPEIMKVEQAISFKPWSNESIIRGGSQEVNEDETVINKILKEELQREKLEKSLVSKSIDKDTGKQIGPSSPNKIALGIIHKLEPGLEFLADHHQPILRFLVELERPIKPTVNIPTVQGGSKNKIKVTVEAKKPSQKEGSSFIPGAEALIPLNPKRWPGFIAGSTMASPHVDWSTKVTTPINTLVVAGEYLSYSHSDVQWRARFRQVVQDTVTINLIAEQNQVGPFLAGVLSNQIADGYGNEVILTLASKNVQEKLNLEIFKQYARERNRDAADVLGTGIMRENVPEYMRDNIWQNTERNERPKDLWEDSNSGIADEFPDTGFN